MTEKLKKLTNVSLIILGILILSGFIFGLYWYINQGGSEDNTNNKTQPSINSKVEDLGNGWMKYTNYDYRLSFEYPDYWVKEDLDRKISSINTYVPIKLYINKEDAQKCPNTAVRCEDYLSINLYNDNSLFSDKPLFEWFENLDKEGINHGGSESVEISKIIVANKESWKAKMIPTAGDVNPDYRFYLIEVPNGDKKYIFQLSIYDENNINNEVVQRIISTLSFL